MGPARAAVLVIRRRAVVVLRAGWANTSLMPTPVAVLVPVLVPVPALTVMPPPPGDA